MSSTKLGRGGPDAVDIAAYLADLRARGYGGVAVMLTACRDPQGNDRLYITAGQVEHKELRKGESGPVGWSTFPGGVSARFEAAIFAALVRFDRELALREAEAERQASF